MNLALIYPATGQQVRMVGTPEKPEWVAKDVCEVLGINTEQIRRLDEDEKGLRTIQTLGGPQEMATVTEPGLYALILTSRKPEAKQFKRWITHEVLPAIRKQGYYAPSAEVDVGLAQMTNDVVVAVREVGAAVAKNTEALEAFTENTQANLKGLDDRVTNLERSALKRKHVKPWQKRLHVWFVEEQYGGRCPCCETSLIAANGNLTEGRAAEYDHFYQPHLDGLWGVWLICIHCHAGFDPPRGMANRENRRPVWDYYQLRLTQWIEKNPNIIREAKKDCRGIGQMVLFPAKKDKT